MSGCKLQPAPLIGASLHATFLEEMGTESEPSEPPEHHSSVFEDEALNFGGPMDLRNFITWRCAAAGAPWM